ncbi:hypothetical protein Q4595_16315 [Wenyingzhuangia sp. 1_MG-2023]|nr:hypothetical protein [Wenyingzhuangia sp. 1_MG-2023]
MKIESVIISFDFLMSELNNSLKFHIHETLEENKEHLKDIDIYDAIEYCEQFGKLYGYIEDAEISHYFRLTPLGLDLVKYGKGHLNFQRKLKWSLSSFEILSLILIAIGYSLSFWTFHNDSKMSERLSKIEFLHEFLLK